MIMYANAFKSKEQQLHQWGIKEQERLKMWKTFVEG